MLHQLFFDTTLVTDDVVEGYYAPFENKEVRETLIMCMVHFDDTYPRSLLKGIRQKTLVFSGADDQIHTEDVVRGVCADHSAYPGMSVYATAAILCTRKSRKGSIPKR